MNFKKIIPCLIIGSLPISAMAQTAPDPDSAAVNQALGTTNPITSGMQYSQQSSQYRQSLQSLQSGQPSADWAQTNENLQNNSAEYQQDYQRSIDVQNQLNKATDFANQDEPDTGVFSRIRNQEREAKRNGTEKSMDGNTQSDDTSTTTAKVAGETATRFAGVGHAVDAITLSVGSNRIVLTGVKAFGNGESCTMNDNYVWPCGNEGRAATEAIVSNTRLVCQIQSGDHGICYDRADGQPIQKKIVRTGFAVPDGQEGLNYEEDASFAKEHHLGIFQGDN